jgi:lysophospholipase L1-like esterase
MTIANHRFRPAVLRAQSLVAALVLLAAVLTSLPSGATVTSANAQTPRKLVILGASYAKSWGTPPLPGYSVVNRGAGGEQTKGMRARFPKDVVALQPHAVLIWGHINNITQSNVANATAEQAAAVKKAAREDYLAMLQQARAAGIEVMLATEIPLAEPSGLMNEARALVGRLLGKQSYAERVNVHVRDLNAFVRELAAREGLMLLDFEKVFAPEGGARQPDYATEDRSHVTAAGYQALTKYAVAQLGKRR